MISGEIHVVDIISHATLLEYQDISHLQTMHTIIKLHSPYILHPNLITRTMQRTSGKSLVYLEFLEA